MMTKWILPLLLAGALVRGAAAEPTISIDATQAKAKVSPLFYGMMTEEINHGYDGGLYAELVQNRAFLDDKTAPAHWSAVGGAAISLDESEPLSVEIPVSLKVELTQAYKTPLGGVANDGYWGFPIRPQTTYKGSFYAKAEKGYNGEATVSLQSKDGKTTYASAKVDGLGWGWANHHFTLKTGDVKETADARLVVTFSKPGTVWLSLVSLFPPTYKDQPNGFRPDIMQMLVDMKPKFLRFPGGNYLEGDRIADYFDWKKTLGPLSRRPGHMAPWTYRSTDGMGLYEFLMWCEDMDAEPLLGVYAGYSLKGAIIQPGPDLEPYVQEALDEIEYVIGPADSKWGSERAKAGHPEPFKMQYVEIGNEDWFDKTGSYNERYKQFHDAIKAKYPQLKLISSVGHEQPEDLWVKSVEPDVIDEHFYLNADEFLKRSRDYYDNRDRKGPEIFVGEWAAHETSFKPWDPPSKNEPPTPNMTAAIGDAAWMTNMEKNSDIVVMNCYAPLLVNVNPGARQWRPDLIGYDTLNVYGSPSYYAIRMFANNIGDEILKTTTTDTPVYVATTRDSKSGEIFVKLVNAGDDAAPVKMDIQGGDGLASTAEAIVLAAAPDATNSIDNPKAVVPKTTEVSGVKPGFTYTVPAHGIVVLKLKKS